MSRLVNTADINNVLMYEKSNYGIFATEIDRIISGIVSKCPTIEQEPVIDKIRAKIYEDYLTAQDDTNSGDDTDLGIAIGLKMALDTIDKYMRGDDR